MSFAKHEPKQTKTVKKKAAQPAAPFDYAEDYKSADHSHSGCVEQALDGLTDVISTYVTQARNGDNGSGLYSTPNGYPVRLALVECEDLTVILECEALDRMADAFERIADAMTKTA